MLVVITLCINANKPEQNAVAVEVLRPRTCVMLTLMQSVYSLQRTRNEH